jgi:hypothetical protein
MITTHYAYDYWFAVLFAGIEDARGAPRDS